MPEAGWEHYDPPADVGTRGWCPDPASALEQAGLALAFEMGTRRMLVSAFKVTVGEGGIRAPVRAEPVDVERHKPAGEVKGATLTDPRAERLDSDGGGHAWWRYSLRRGRAMELNRPRKSGDCGWIMGPRGLMRIPGILHSGESLWTPGLLDRWPMSPRFRGS